MKVLVLTGPESSGKSWLASEIQARFGGLVVGEYVRYFIDEQRRDTCYADIGEIARGQLAWEDAARAAKPSLLVLDTHLLSNMLWSRCLFGDCPGWLENELLARRYDQHLLLDPAGVPWIEDGQRCQPQLAERQAFHQACRDWLLRHGQPFSELCGSWSERRQAALEQVAALLGSADQHAGPSH
ncbi:AAA family ATPase [Pseudomonas sp. KB-10]|uniref:AAA family ATPase n=1 Tax=Pseudomonas sp. KB-10 TaxID=2292264 RepID=UPI001BB07868|nr:AAA family ATPase [Pseudomonas sp. KB-10]